MAILTTDEENPIIFAASTTPNIPASYPFTPPVTYGTRGNDWRQSNPSPSQTSTPEMIDAYFTYLRGTNQALSDDGLLGAFPQYGLDTTTKKYILTNPNLPLQDTNIYRPVEYNDTAYLINTRNPAESKKLSDSSGKLIKANINASAAARLLRAQAQQAAPAAEPEPEAEAEPGAVVRVPRDNVPQAPPAGAPGERRRGRPAGVANTPREAQPRQRGDVNIPTQFADRGLEAGFTNLPRNDFRRLAVNDAIQTPRIGDRGASARDNMLGRAGQVTSVFNVGPSKIYFIRLNTPEPTTIASINIQPGNRNYVVVGNRSYSLNSPRELMTFLQNRDLAEDLRTSMFKVHLQENPHMLDEIKQLKNNPTMQEAYSTEESFKDYSNDALTDMIINLSRYEGNEKEIQGVKDELARRKQNKSTNNNKMTKEDLKNYIREALNKKLNARQTFAKDLQQDPDYNKAKEDAKRITPKFIYNYKSTDHFNDDVDDYRVPNVSHTDPFIDKDKLKKIRQSMKMSEFKSLVKEAIRKKLAENQPAPSRENPDRETIERDTEEEK